MKTKLLSTYGYSRVYKFDGTGPSGIFFSAGLAINADGSPRAYHPKGSPPGLDHLANAGRPGDWWGIATNSGGTPYVQGATDAAPGYYVSTTALFDKTHPTSSPQRYVDSEGVNFIVMPRSFGQGIKLGDFAVVVNLGNQAYEYAVYADIGPKDQIGEGSMALAGALGINNNPRNGGTGHGIVTVVFPGSAKGWPQTAHQIEAAGAALFDAWGGMEMIKEIYS